MRPSCSPFGRDTRAARAPQPRRLVRTLRSSSVRLARPYTVTARFVNQPGSEGSQSIPGSCIARQQCPSLSRDWGILAECQWNLVTCKSAARNPPLVHPCDIGAQVGLGHAFPAVSRNAPSCSPLSGGCPVESVRRTIPGAPAVCSVTSITREPAQFPTRADRRSPRSRRTDRTGS